MDCCWFPAFAFNFRTNERNCGVDDGRFANVVRDWIIG